ncbi:MAG: hypothetical protein L0Z73_10105 [Gammaproteobacteria bacterium]|nr:hypothetical protein [Gammaproteobacteria bacterium]
MRNAAVTGIFLAYIGLDWPLLEESVVILLCRSGCYSSAQVDQVTMETIQGNNENS